MAQASESNGQSALNLIYLFATLHPFSTLTSPSFSREIPQFGEDLRLLAGKRKQTIRGNTHVLKNHYKLLCRAMDTRNTN